MSSALAIAGVSAVLKDLLDNAVIDASANAPIKITTQAPHRCEKYFSEVPYINLFLYHLDFNTGWRNMGLPSCDGGGQRLSNPLLALNLRYVVAASGTKDIESEILLGYAMKTLHENPVLTRDAIRTALASGIPDVGTAVLPAPLQPQNQIGLADQVEQIRITPQPMNSEELSKMWTALQAKQNPSMAYLVTVVLIESKKLVRNVLPVLTRGKAAGDPAREEGIAARPYIPCILPAYPTLLAARVSDYHPAAQVGVRDPDTNAVLFEPDTVYLFGHHLAGSDAKVVLTHSRLGTRFTVALDAQPFSSPPTAAEVRDGEVDYELPESVRQVADVCVSFNLDGAEPAHEGDELTPGVYSLQLSVIPSGDTVARTTNAIPFAVAPRLVLREQDGVSATLPQNDPEEVAPASITANVHCAPGVRFNQDAIMVLGDRELRIVRTDSQENPVYSDLLTFEGNVPREWLAASASRLARLQVDGVESVYIKRFGPGRPPEFDDSQMVMIPVT